jgi:Tol biopolymer transport system component
VVFGFALVGFLAMNSTPAEATSHRDDRIVFASNRTTGPGVYNPTHDFEIFTADRDGKHPRQLTFNKGTDEYPAYSPDGTRIAFSTNRDDNYEVYEMETDGSNPTDLTNNPANDFQAAYSPDGTRIAFYTSRDGDYEVYAMNSDGSDQTNLTNAPASDDYEPAWHPEKK